MQFTSSFKLRLAINGMSAEFQDIISTPWFMFSHNYSYVEFGFPSFIWKRISVKRSSKMVRLLYIASAIVSSFCFFLSIYLCPSHLLCVYTFLCRWQGSL